MNREEDHVVSSVYKTHTELADGEYVARNREWGAWARRNGLQTIEYLLPRVVRQCSTALPQYMRANPNVEEADLKKLVEAYGPWRVPFQLTEALSTKDKQRYRDGMTYRSHLLCDTVEEILGDRLRETTILDMATRNGYFAFDMAYRGAGHVHGVDVRPESIRQAEFLKRYYRIDHVSFETANVFDLPDEPYDVVFNFGLLYHVVDPLRLMQRTYDLCKAFAVVDTVVRLEPIQAFFLVTDQDTEDPARGEFSIELHPTYRALIALMRHVGFKDMIELTGASAAPNHRYVRGHRRCIIGYK